MKELLNIQARVHAILTHFPATRSNDMLLYLKLAQSIDAEYHQKALNRPFKDVLLNLEEYHLPSFGSVGRARRKLQEKYPELRADNNVQQLRDQQEEKYREYARS